MPGGAHPSAGAVEINPLNVVVVGVAPVHGAGAVVQRQPIGPQHVGGDEDATVGSVHPGFFDAPDAVVHLVLFPIGPVHPATANTQAWITNRWRQLLPDYTIPSNRKLAHYEKMRKTCLTARGGTNSKFSEGWWDLKCDLFNYLTSSFLY